MSIYGTDYRKIINRMLHTKNDFSLDKYPMWVYNKYTYVGYLSIDSQKRKKEGFFVVHTKENNRAMEKCNCTRTKERTGNEYKSLINRLNRIEGQIRGIKGMVEKNAYCIDILTQASAVSAALSAFNKELLSEHIKTCVANDIRAGNDETIDELLSALQKLMK